MPPTDKAAKKAVPAIRGYLETLRSLQERPVSIAVPETRIPDIIADKRFKTQFETGHSRGLLAPEARAESEQAMFGYPLNLPEHERPIYGHFSDRTLEPSVMATGYGDWNVVLDPARTKDATIVIGDSLGRDADWVIPAASPFSQQGRRGLRQGFYGNRDKALSIIRDKYGDMLPEYDLNRLLEDYGRSYIEAQVHKGVPWSDVRALVNNDMYAARNYLDDKNYGPNASLHEMVAKAKVPAFLHAGSPRFSNENPNNVWRMIEPGMESSRQWRSIPPEALADIGYRDGGEVESFDSGGKVGALRKLIKAYHGSPYDFEAFDPRKIGTGEGAQAYGHGLYFAENEDIARHYRDALKGKNDFIEWNGEKFRRNGHSMPDYLMEMLTNFWSFDPNNPTMDVAKKAALLREDNLRELQALNPNLSGWSEAEKAAFHANNEPKRAGYLRQNELLDRFEKNPLVRFHSSPGRMYEVGIEADPDKFLNWMKPLDESVIKRLTPDVRDAIDYAMEEKGLNPLSFVPDEYSGKHLYQALRHPDVSESLPPVIGSSNWLTGDTNDARHASAYLESLGFPGIMYPDATSRKPGRDVTNNIVTFENTPVSILRKYEQGGEVEHYAGGGQKGALRFVRNMYDALTKTEQEALDAVRKSTNKTGKEALVLGREADGITAVTPGGYDRVSIPSYYEQFALGDPFFTAHTHPTNTLSPSAADIRLWGNQHAALDKFPFQTMFINASPQDSILRIGAAENKAQAAKASFLKNLNNDIVKYTALSHPKMRDYLQANKFIGDAPTFGARGTPMQGVKDYLESSYTNAFHDPVIRDLYAGSYLDDLARAGVPVDVSAEHQIGGTPFLASDVWPDFTDYMRRKGILPKADGGPVEMEKGGVLTRLAKLTRGKPESFKLPGGVEMPSYPIAELEDIAGQFAKRQGHPYPIESFDPLDPDRAARIAAEYDKLIHNPLDPATKRSYEALIDETMDQYNALKPLGLNFEFLRPGEGNPYKASPALGYQDLLEHGRMKVFPTEAGYGTEVDIADNPLLKRVGRIGNLDDATVNDAFRIIHDIYGHYGPGNPFFRAPGEERAWRLHGTMFSPEALPAATTELRGQNSWLNFGPHGVRNRTASQDDTIYAPQKAGLLPSWVWQEKAEGGMVQHFGAGDVVENVAKGALRRFTGARRTREAERLAAEEAAINAARSKDAPAILLPPEPRLQTVNDPVRLSYPGIYKDPRDIAQEAVQSIIPESDAMKLLFGVTRGDLDAIAQGRNYSNMQGLPHAFQFPARGRGADVSESVLTPANARRIIDITNESLKFDPLRFTRSWYEMEPLWDRATQLGLSPDIQRMLNARIGLHSAVASPVSEVNRGTLANKLINEGRLDDYVNFGGYGTKGITTRHGDYRPSRFEVPGFPADMLDMKSHLAHKSHVNKLLELEDTGSYVANAPKVPTYIQATDPITPDARRPIADSHLARGVGYADVRPSAGSAGVELSGPEYRDFLPWWQKVSDKVGEQPRDLQALIWNVLGPQTGVSYIGPPKLEILSNEIMKAARRLGVSPDMARDMVITGKAAAYASGGSVASWNDSSPPYFDYTTPGDGGGTYEEAANNVAGYAEGGSTGSMFLDSSDNLARELNRRMTPDAAMVRETMLRNQRRGEKPSPDISALDALKLYWDSLNKRSSEWSPSYANESLPWQVLQGAGDVGRVAADSLLGDTADRVAATLGFLGGGSRKDRYERERHLTEQSKKDLHPALRDLLGVGGAAATFHPAVAAAQGIGMPVVKAATPMIDSLSDYPRYINDALHNKIAGVEEMLDMIPKARGALSTTYEQPLMEARGYADGGPVNTAYPNGGQVEGYRFGGELDQWYGQPGMSMYADGGPVEMKDGGFLHDVLGTLGSLAGNLIPIPFFGPAVGKFAGHTLGNLIEGGTGEIGDDAARDFTMGYIDPDRMGFAQGGRVDDDMLLYHAIDTQPFARGGALRYCGGGYTR